MTDRTCVIDGCGKPHEARGWCQAHYKRWQLHGDPLAAVQRPRGRTAGTLAERLAANSRVTATGCIEWTGVRHAKGYGRTKINGRTRGVHRLAWEQAHGPIPDGQMVRHLVCDNPPCFNVEHLALGTHLDNMGDKVASGNSARGSGTAARKLTWLIVDAMRADLADGMTLVAAAAKYGVAKSLVGRIRLGQAWDSAKREAS